MMNSPDLQVAIDIGSREHYVAIGLSDGGIVDEFSISHTPQGFAHFFDQIHTQECLHALPVVIAMEGCNGWARPLDSEILMHGYPLYNVNNLKLARFKEIFPAPAKTDLIDTHKMLDLFKLQAHLPMAKQVLQQVLPVPESNRILKRLTRRRRQLVNDKISIINRLQADLQAICPGMLEITGSADNLWFLNFLTCRNDITKLLRLRTKSVLAITGVGLHYAQKIQHWQHEARMSEEVSYAGSIIVDDAARVLALRQSIRSLEKGLHLQTEKSVYAQRIGTIPGFGVVCCAELAGEIGSLQRFPKESSFSLYLGMAPLDKSSGGYKGTKAPRQINARACKAMTTGICRHMSCA